MTRKPRMHGRPPITAASRVIRAEDPRPLNQSTSARIERVECVPIWTDRRPAIALDSERGRSFHARMVKVVLGVALLCLACVSPGLAPSSVSAGARGAASAAPPRAVAAEEPVRAGAARRAAGRLQDGGPPGLLQARLLRSGELLRQEPDGREADAARRVGLRSARRPRDHHWRRSRSPPRPCRRSRSAAESRTFRIDHVDQPWSLRTTLQDILRFAQARLQPVPRGAGGAQAARDRDVRHQRHALQRSIRTPCCSMSPPTPTCGWRGAAGGFDWCSSWRSTPGTAAW